MLLQLLAAPERRGQLVDDVVFLRGQGVGVRRVHCGEVAVLQGVGGSANSDGLVLIVDLVQQQAVLHAELGVPDDLLALQLEEDDGDGLVHPGGEELILLRILLRVRPRQLHGKAVGVAVLVHLVGEDGQGPQGDTVAGLDDLQVVVVDGVGQHRGHQRPGTGGGAHPQNIVVAPLDVHAVVVQQGVHDNIRPWTAVEDIAHDVQMVHRQALDDAGHRLDEAGGLADADDGVDDVLVVIPLVGLLVVGVEQLVDDVGIVLGQSLSHLGAGVLGGHPAADFNEPVEGDLVPLVQILYLLLHQGQLFLGVIDERGQLIPVVPGHAGAEQLIQFLFNHAGTGVQDVQERLVFSVDIGDEVLRALRQVHNGLQVDDLRAGGLDGGILFGQQLQIAQFLRLEGLLGLHNGSLLLGKPPRELIHHRPVFWEPGICPQYEDTSCAGRSQGGRGPDFGVPLSAGHALF